MEETGWAWVKVPEKLSKRIIEFGKDIPNDELHEHGREKNPHITAKYGLISEDDDVKNILLNKHGGSVTVGKSSIFENDEFDVVKLSVFGDDIHRIHNILNKLPHNDEFTKYQPHITIAYVKKGLGKKYIGKFSLSDTFKFDTIWYRNPNSVDSIPIRLSRNHYFNLKKFKS